MFYPILRGPTPLSSVPLRPFSKRWPLPQILSRTRDPNLGSNRLSHPSFVYYSNPLVLSSFEQVWGWTLKPYIVCLSVCKLCDITVPHISLFPTPSTIPVSPYSLDWHKGDWSLSALYGGHRRGVWTLFLYLQSSFSSPLSSFCSVNRSISVSLESSTTLSHYW